MPSAACPGLGTELGCTGLTAAVHDDSVAIATAIKANACLMTLTMTVTVTLTLTVTSDDSGFV